MTKEEIEGNAELKKKVDSYAEDMEKLLKQEHERDKKYIGEMISPYDKKRVDTLWEIISDLTQEQREYVMSKGIIGRDTQEKA